MRCIIYTGESIFSRWSALNLLSSLTAGVYSVCFAGKSTKQFLNLLIVQRLDEILNVLNEVDADIRRTMAYLREARVLKLDAKHEMYDLLSAVAMNQTLLISFILGTTMNSAEGASLQ